MEWDDKNESKRLLEREWVHSLGYESEMIIFMERKLVIGSRKKARIGKKMGRDERTKGRKV